MDDINLKQIKTTELFENFNQETIEFIFNNYKGLFYIKAYDADEIIYMQNQKCRTMDLILEGEVIIKRIDINGNVMIMNSFKKGQNISGNLLFSKNAYYPMTVFSNKKTKVLHLKREFVLQLCHSNKMFLETFMESLSSKEFMITQRVTLLSLDTIREKIIFYLQQQSLQENSNIIQITSSKKELASKLCIARTSLSRELNALKKEGFVDYDNKTFFLKDKLFSIDL